MPDSLFLFEQGKPEFQSQLQKRLAELAANGLFLGTSSWKYEGWLDQIYTPSRYQSRGRFSRKRFETECLAEYAETFPIVCGDFSFYQFPSAEFWRKLFMIDAPPSLQFALKIPEEITVRTFPNHPRYGPRAGRRNASFLDASLLSTAFLERLEPYRDRVAVLIFEFGALRTPDPQRFQEFPRQLDILLGSLPSSFRYAVEVRNAEFLDSPYFQVLKNNGVAHVFNAWTRMPPLSEQIAIPNAFTANFSVSRAVLRTGRTYEEAGRAFSPFRTVQDVNEEVRQGLRALLARGSRRGEPVYIFVHNGLEGNAPGTIEAVVQTL